MADIQLSKYSSDLANHSEVQKVIDQFAGGAVPYFKVMVVLPTAVANTSSDELFAKAAVLRSNLDALSTLQSGLYLVRLQIKNAFIVAEQMYKSALTTVYRQSNPDVKSAKSYEEREMIARSYIDSKIVEEFNFWSHALENVDDTIEIIGTKLKMFKGGLDTILTMLGLLKVSAQLRGITLNAGQLDKLLEAKQVVTSQEEGEMSFGG